MAAILLAAKSALFRTLRFLDKFFKPQVQPCFVRREIQRLFNVQGIPGAGRDKMEAQQGDHLVFEPEEVAIGRELKAIGVVQGIVHESSCKVPDIEAGLDLLDPGRIVPEDPVHPSIDTEPVSFPLERSADRDLGLVGR